MRLIATLFAAALCSSAAHAQAETWITATWSAQPGVTGIKSGCVAPGQYERPLVPINGAVAGSTVMKGFADTGKCYFVSNAGPPDEWVADLAALKFGPAVPGVVGNLAITWTPSAVVPASVTVTNVNEFAEFDVTLVGAVDFRWTAPTGQQFDYCMTGGTTVIATTPPIGTNNEGTRASPITLRGPLTTRCDLDATNGNATVTFNGFTVMVNTVSKPLVRSGNTWAVAF